MTGIAVILHSVKHPRNNVKHPGISDTFHVKMVALKVGLYKFFVLDLPPSGGFLRFLLPVSRFEFTDELSL